MTTTWSAMGLQVIHIIHVLHSLSSGFDAAVWGTNICSSTDISFLNIPYERKTDGSIT